MKLYDRLVVSLGNFLDGPDEEFPMEPADKALGAIVVILIVGFVVMAACL